MNHEELRSSVVAELQRHSGGSPQSSDELYNAIGGQKSGLSFDDFRSFLQHSNIPRSHDIEGENVSPRYHVPSVKRKMSRNQKRSSSRSSRAGTPDSTLKRFNPKTEGFMSLFNCARRLQHNSDSGNIAWNEIRNLYRKETGRHLNSEELNLICGTVNQTKHDLLTEKLRSIFETVDSKGLIVRLNVFSTPSPSVISEENDSPTSPQLSPQSSNNLEENLKMQEKRRKITESLIRSGHLRDDGGRVSDFQPTVVSSVEAEPTPMDEIVEEAKIVEVSTEESQTDTEKVQKVVSEEVEKIWNKQEITSVLIDINVTEQTDVLESENNDQTLESSPSPQNDVENLEEVAAAPVDDAIPTESEEPLVEYVVSQETSGEVDQPAEKECLNPNSSHDQPETSPTTDEMCSDSKTNNDTPELEANPVHVEVKDTLVEEVENVVEVSEMTAEENEKVVEKVEEMVVLPEEAKDTEVETTVHLQSEANSASIGETVPDSATFEDSQSNEYAPEDTEKLLETETQKNSVPAIICSASGDSSTITTTVTTVTTTITPVKLNKTTDREDVPHDGEVQTDKENLDAAGSSSSEVYITHTVDLQGKGQSANVNASVGLPTVEQECLQVEKKAEEVAPVASEERVEEEKEQPTEDTISSLSPQRDLDQRPFTIQPLPSTSSQNTEATTPPKKEKKVRIRLPRRRLFGCCSIF